ncbi:unnamed protein product, partial [Ixodes pacificus]
KKKKTLTGCRFSCSFFEERAEKTVGFSAQLDISPSHPASPRKARTRRQQVFADDKFWASRRHQRRSEFVCTVGIGRKCDARVGSESHLAFGGTSHSRACGCGLGVRCLGVAPSAFPGAQPCRRQPWGEARACAEAIPRPDRHIPIKGIN